MSFCGYLRSLESPRNGDRHQVPTQRRRPNLRECSRNSAHIKLSLRLSDATVSGKRRRRRRSSCTTDWRSFLTSIWRYRVLEIANRTPLSDRGRQDAEDREPPANPNQCSSRSPPLPVLSTDTLPLPAIVIVAGVIMRLPLHCQSRLTARKARSFPSMFHPRQPRLFVADPVGGDRMRDGIDFCVLREGQ